MNGTDLALRSALLRDLVRRVDFVLDTDCWEWRGARDENGYGFWRFRGRQTRAHRMVWERLHGPVPDDLCVLHRCDNPPCCNPAHLFLGSRGDNNRDRSVKGRNATGERNGKARLTAQRAAEIRTVAGVWGYPHRRIAKPYGLSHATVGTVLRGQAWQGD